MRKKELIPLKMSLKGILPSEVLRTEDRFIHYARNDKEDYFSAKITITYLMLRFAIIIFSTLGLICIDYISKQYMVDILNGRDMVLLGEWIKLQLSYNPGVAFSIPITGLPLQILTIIAISGLIWYYSHVEYPKKFRLLDSGYILIIAGALSHAYERIFVGYVVDFIAVKYFAILNFADIFISIGALLLFVGYYCTPTNNDLKDAPNI